MRPYYSASHKRHIHTSSTVTNKKFSTKLCIEDWFIQLRASLPQAAGPECFKHKWDEGMLGSSIQVFGDISVNGVLSEFQMTRR